MATKGPDPTVTDEQLISAIDHSKRPFATAGEIADTVGLSNYRVRQRLEQLDDQGKIERARIGGGPFIYWLEDSFDSSPNSDDAS